MLQNYLYYQRKTTTGNFVGILDQSICSWNDFFPMLLIYDGLGQIEDNILFITLNL